ncbi:MAG: NUDIX hydrolase [Planctomycetota bacterium]
MDIAFCSVCGSPCEQRIPEGDNRERAVCAACGHIHYVNPNVVVGCIVEAGEKILLCKRAIEPALGKWTFPAGFLECNESSPEGAARETYEESEAEVEILGLHSMLDIPHISQAYVVFRARLIGTHFGPGDESSEVELVDIDDVPWEELAFPSVSTALRLYVDDRRAGRHRTHIGVVEWNGRGSRFDVGQYTLRDHIEH